VDNLNAMKKSHSLNSKI